jgi:excisionase family DNA binding protein
MRSWLSVREVADEIGVSPQAVRNWIARDEMSAVRVSARGAFRIPAFEIEAFRRRAVPFDLGNGARAVSSRDITDPTSLHAAWIVPVLLATGATGIDSLLLRMLDG